MTAVVRFYPGLSTHQTVPRLCTYLTALTSTSLQTIASLAPNIERLQLDYCGQLDAPAFRSLWRLSHLRHLELYGPYLVRREDWLEFLRERGEQLTSFLIRETPRFDRTCIETLAQHCVNVTELRLAQVGKLDDEGAQCLAGMRCLHHIDLSQPGVSQPGVPPASLTDKGVIPVLERHGTHLRSLHLGKNEALSDATIDAIGAKIECLILDFLAHVHESTWIRLWHRCTQLTSVSVRGIGMTDASLEALVRHARSLQVLNINSNDDLTPAAFYALAEARLPLKTLDVGFVRCVDDSILSMLADAMPTLKALYVFGCPRVTHFTRADITVVGREQR